MYKSQCMYEDNVSVQPTMSTHSLWKELVAADQMKWTPALCQAPVCLKWSGQSEYTANKWMHSILFWLRFSISLITLITLLLVAYLMLSQWLTVLAEDKTHFSKDIYKQRCVPHSRGLS